MFFIAIYFHDIFANPFTARERDAYVKSAKFERLSFQKNYIIAQDIKFNLENSVKRLKKSLSEVSSKIKEITINCEENQRLLEKTHNFSENYNDLTRLNTLNYSELLIKTEEYNTIKREIDENKEKIKIQIEEMQKASEKVNEISIRIQKLLFLRF